MGVLTQKSFGSLCGHLRHLRIERLDSAFPKIMEMNLSDDHKRDPQTYGIIGAALEVHHVLGCGFLEAVYQEALAKEFILRGIPFKREAELPIDYKGEQLNAKYKADFICYDDIIVELKALDDISGKEKAQVINYLKASKFLRSLLINFGTMRLQYERLVFTGERNLSTDYAD